MFYHVDKEIFVKALAELGHDPKIYEGKKLSLDNMARLYDFAVDKLLEAIEQRVLEAHYDYYSDTIWIDALEAAHFHFCVRSANAAQDQELDTELSSIPDLTAQGFRVGKAR